MENEKHLNKEKVGKILSTNPGGRKSKILADLQYLPTEIARIGCTPGMVFHCTPGHGRSVGYLYKAEL